MIDIKVEKDESRPRDKKRRRLLLVIGNDTIRYHLTREEARRLRTKLNRLSLD